MVKFDEGMQLGIENDFPDARPYLATTGASVNQTTPIEPSKTI